MNIYGLIGYPLSHSFSKKYFTAKFEKENIANCLFELFPLEQISALPDLVKKINPRGLAVTIPHKEAVLKYIDVVDDAANATMAVNCIKISGDTLKGYNTDIVGFEKSLIPLLQENHTQALILGSGGSSKAVQYVLRKLGIAFLIVTRNASKEKWVVQYDDIDEKMIREYPLIINCTPVGMSPNENTEPAIPYRYLDENNFLYDLIYNPPLTPFLKRGIEKNTIIKNGYEMLVIQAEENWRIWNSL